VAIGGGNSLFGEGTPAAQQWEHRQATRVLKGRARQVAHTIRTTATNGGLDPARGKPAEEAAAYLHAARQLRLRPDELSRLGPEPSEEKLALPTRARARPGGPGTRFPRSVHEI
jgi:hypothetical protein